MTSWRIIDLFRGRRAAPRREEERAPRARAADAPGWATPGELIDRVLADTGAIPLPPGAIDPARAVSAHADSFLTQCAVGAYVGEDVPGSWSDRAKRTGDDTLSPSWKDTSLNHAVS